MEIVVHFWLLGGTESMAAWIVRKPAWPEGSTTINFQLKWWCFPAVMDGKEEKMARNSVEMHHL